MSKAFTREDDGDDLAYVLPKRPVSPHENLVTSDGLAAIELEIQRLEAEHAGRQPTYEWGAMFLDRWYGWAIRSRLEPIKDVARTVMKHRDGILRWFESQIANGLIEGINSLVQAAKAKARGYRSIRTLTNIAYLIAGKLDLRLPT